MAETKCPACAAPNPGDAMFCQECGDYLQQSDRATIERQQEQAECQRCGHYNPIEAKSCESCSANLATTQAAVYRDENGRLRLVREPPLSLPVRIFCGLGIAACLMFAGRMAYFQFGATGAAPAKLLRNPLAVATGLYLLVSAFVLGSRQTRLEYKFRALFVLGLSGVFLFEAAFGGDLAAWDATGFDQVVLWAHMGGMIYCMVFLLRAEFLRSVTTVLAFLVGLWCAYPGLQLLFAGGGYTTLANRLVRFGDVPWALTPGFLAFNVFLPYVFLMMLAQTGHLWAGTRQYVVHNPTDKAVLRRYRSRSLRGTVLDLFVAGTLIGVGLWQMHLRRLPNLLTPMVKVWLILSRP